MPLSVSDCLQDAKYAHMITFLVVGCF